MRVITKSLYPYRNCCQPATRKSEPDANYITFQFELLIFSNFITEIQK